MPTILRHGALFLAAICASSHAAEPYPQRPVTLIVPTAPAGGTDTIARIMAEFLGKQLGQPFVVENKPGANGVLGVEAGARAAPDGYRLLFTYAASVVVNPGLYRKLPYDPVKDLAPIAQIGRGGNLLLVRPDFPARTLDEFVREVKEHPGKYSYCSWGAGSGGHLAMESLKKQAGIDMLHVPYKGTSPCVQDLAGKQVDAAFGDTSSTIELVKAGRVRALANSGPKRLPMLPDVPTMTEAGYPFTTYSWYGLLAPAHTPPDIIGRLNAAVQKALVDPEVVRRMRELNFDDLPQTTPAQFGAVIRRDLQDWRGLIRSINLSLD